MLRVAFHTFGCKLNFAETSGISRELDGAKYDIVNFREVADVYVIHSCMVTANAEKKTIMAIKQAHRRNPDARIAVIGCMAELQREKLNSLPGVKIILGNEDKFNLQEFLENSKLEGQTGKLQRFMPSWSVHERTRSFLKIQDGCDYFCAYCTIPYARGRSRSGSIADIVKAAKEITASGVKEIVLTGVNIGDFGRRQNENLYELLLALHELEGLERMRISSIEPDLLDRRIIELAADRNKLLPHFHIPLQSGSKEVLSMMKRKYTTDLFREKVNEILERLPLACIATDVIAGFPGETDELFREGKEFIASLELSYMHVFTYSARRGTRAESSASMVPAHIKKERGRQLQELSDAKKLEFYSKNRGRTARVFFESENKGGYIQGFTENYIAVRHPYSSSLKNQICEVILKSQSTNEFFDVELVQ
jgi:threonylcarbamoyladenosine tRNA methylthiotransferase MtaB